MKWSVFSCLKERQIHAGISGTKNVSRVIFKDHNGRAWVDGNVMSCIQQTYWSFFEWKVCWKRNKIIALFVQIMAQSILEFLDAPIVRGSIFQILHLNCNHGFRMRSQGEILARGQQFRRQWTVHGVGEEDELKLYLRELSNIIQ